MDQFHKRREFVTALGHGKIDPELLRRWVAKLRRMHLQAHGIAAENNPLSTILPDGPFPGCPRCGCRRDRLTERHLRSYLFEIHPQSSSR